MSEKQKMSTKKKNIIIGSSLAGGIAVSVAVPLAISSVFAPPNFAEEFRVGTVEADSKQFEKLSEFNYDEEKNLYSYKGSFVLKFDEPNSNQWLTGRRFFDNEWSYQLFVYGGGPQPTWLANIRVNNLDSTYLQTIDYTIEFSDANSMLNQSIMYQLIVDVPGEGIITGNLFEITFPANWPAE